MMNEIARQLHAELQGAAHSLLFDFDPDLAIEVGARLNPAAERTAILLCSDDETEATGAAADVMAALWPHGDPETVGQPQWWATPLGQAVARTVDRSEAQAVTQHVAAEILGVTRGTVAQLAHRGRISRHPDGGLVRADVLHYLANRRTS